ncbi:MAG: protein translocase subunit SecF [Candidatus Syntrophonatronum acetioxidans]|uniref:Protein-export membrane protein SecF n=1 Tax=Candidatus Syntrophonatronum acetioxidans TaxID=1795816 RepID=A0A424Y9T5_9FIRM|nr:MAG: protein translocase subunit SecF [Candidatus Syntrophonatronum acetioxidans]
MLNLKVINYRKHAALFSAFIILIGVISLIFNGLNLGIDFTGGTNLHYKIGEPFQVEEVREVLEEFGLGGSFVQKVGHAGLAEEEKDEVLIKTVSLEEEERNQIFMAIQERWDQGEAEIVEVENVGGVIGRELQRDAALALIIATLGMIAYITIRFEFRFAMSAIAALVHDIIILLTVVSLLQIEINSPFVAAILTIFGYSINDTIVVFDRIRENLKGMKTEDYAAVVNESINQTIIRSINTSVTTLLVLLALFIFGGVTLRPFIAALLVGVISGTYSSLFVASPLWVTWKEWDTRKKRKVEAV